MKIDDKGHNLEMENLQLLDISSEDDYLVAYPFRNSLQDLRLSVTFERTNAHDGFKLFGKANTESEIHQQRDHVVPEIMEPQRPSFLRKSLAWDSEFFTSGGVLDPEELSLINKGFKKADVSQLPRIHEDVRMCRSADSKSTVNVSNKSNIGSQNKLKSMSASKSESIKMGHTSQHSGSKESIISSPKPPRILRQGYLNVGKQTERASLGSDSVKMNHKTRKTLSGPDSSVSKKSRLDLSGPTSSDTPPPKSASSLSAMRIKDTTLCCPPYDPSSSASSSKHLSMSTTRVMNSSDITLGPSSSMLHFSLISNHSSWTSPARSTNGWSSEPVSSTSLSSKICHGRTPSRETATTRRSRLVNNASKASDLQSHLLEQSSSCQVIEGTEFTCQPTKRGSIGTGSVSVGSKRNAKSSGLRMPSPKIGFFDEEQSMQPIMRGRVGFHLGESPLPNVYGPTSEKRPSRFRSDKNLREPDLSSAMVRESSSKIRKTGVSSALRAEGIQAKGVSRNKISFDRKRQKDVACALRGAVNTFRKKHEEATPVLLASNLNSVHESQKENKCRFEDQVNGLSRYLEGVDLNRDLVRADNKKLSYSYQQFHDQKQGPPEISVKPGSLSLSAAIDLTPQARTPLADRTSASNRGRLLGLSMVSTSDMLIEKPSFHLPEGRERENI